MYIDPDLHAAAQPERRGHIEDIRPVLTSDWTLNTEVRYTIWPIRGRWHIYILFFALNLPLKLMVRRLSHYASLKQAETFASIFQRGIRKDARGTLKRTEHAYYISPN